ncbi:signal peptidase II [Limosilactobacillus difficilis]|uniref:signal peptidase II n=1 Tax=Limosilactobacillus difficilis TaxID=2991838 RepID=UPI0024BBB07D|nr:signal peptidase II [Limosilactobacillus difficilis]
MWLYPLLTIIFLILDQVVKLAVATHIPVNHVLVMIPGVLGLTNLHNKGAAWSILSGQQWFFVLITLLALTIIGWLMAHFRSNRPVMICLSLILAGTLGNFIDRLRLGYVIDMFETLFVNFPVFNVADSCLTIGVLALAWFILKDDD